jgi:hypothetical protein
MAPTYARGLVERGALIMSYGRRRHRREEEE